MKKLCSLRTSLVLVLTSLLFFSSCRKVNVATTLGDDLVPEVDNINTFDTLFATETDNVLLIDTARLVYEDPVALGAITNDPEFGQTNATVYFQIKPPVYGKYPFTSKNPEIDSVVLSLDYLGGYGDVNTPQTVRVYEIAQTSAFSDTGYYKFDHQDFETTGVELGQVTFSMNSLKDSIPIVRKGTVKVANQLRIRLDKTLGQRFASYDSTTGPKGAYHDDTLFQKLFRGFALKADEGIGNGIAYFSLANSDKTKLTIYYHATTNGTTDTTQVEFKHALRIVDSVTRSSGGQANSIRRQQAGGWDAYLKNSTAQDDKLYIQSTPAGSFGYIKIPALDVFENKLIHRAELIATRIPSAFDNWFTAPTQLFMDKTNNSDSGFIFQEYLMSSSTTGMLSFNFASFGGRLRADNTYRFNVTSAVQDIITRDSSNYSLRIYASFDARPYDARIRPAIPRFVQTIPYPAYGRVVLAGGNYADPNMKMRLRVIYSNL